MCIRDSIKALTAQGSVQLLATLGHFTAAQQSFIGGIANSAAQLQSSLNEGIGRLDGGWDRLLSDALSAPITNGVLPEEVKRMGPFVRDFASIKEMLGRGTPPSTSDISGVLFSTGIISKDSGVGQAPGLHRRETVRTRPVPELAAGISAPGPDLSLIHI